MIVRQSILHHFLFNTHCCPNKTAALVKRDGVFVAVSWGELGLRVREITAGLVGKGVQPGDRVCLLSTTRLEWVLCDFGILGAGAITVPLYPTNLPDEWQYIADHAGACVIVAEDAEQVRKLRAERSRLGDVRFVVQLVGRVDPVDGWVLSLPELIAAGAQTPADAIDARAAGLHAGAPMTIIYTSGTTGRPKGVVITHAAMMYVADAVSRIHLVDQTDVQLLYLPLAHSFARSLIIGWLATQHVVAFAESTAALPNNLREVRPTVMAGVPRTYERLYAAVWSRAMGHGGWRRHVLPAVAAEVRRLGDALERGEALTLMQRLRYEAARRLMMARIGHVMRQALGGRVRALVSGGAALPHHIGCFFRDAGLEILEGYGLTESSAATCVARPGRNRTGTVGLPLPGTEIKLADDGEVLIRGPGLMHGYYRDDDATREVLRDGWLYTGDIGTFTRDGALRIVDRKKDIIVLLSGKNVAPRNIENLLRSDALISQAVVYGDSHRFLTALLTLDRDALRTMAEQQAFGDRSYAAMTKLQAVRQRVEALVAACNEQLPPHERIRKFKILEHDFSAESGELTPSLKVKRSVVHQRYRTILEGFYEPDPGVPSDEVRHGA